MDAEKRVTEVFEMITDNGLEAMLDFGHGTEQTFSLEAAQALIEPRLRVLDVQLARVLHKHGFNDPLINTIRDAEACSAYVVGIISGIWLAKRPDILGRFAKMYAHTAPEHIDLLFDVDGDLARRRVS